MNQYYFKILTIAIVIFFASKGGLWLAGNDVSLIWLPTGISLAIFLLVGRQVWPGVGIGIFLAHLSVETSWGLTIAAVISNVVQPWLGTHLIHQWKINHQLHRVRDVLGLLIIGVLITPIIGGLIGAISLTITRGYTWSEFLSVYAQWGIGDAMGVLILTPLILIWARNYRDSWKQPLFTITGLSLLVVVNCLVFGLIEIDALSFKEYPLEYLSFPLLIWAGVYCQQHVAITAIFTTTAIAVGATLNSTGPFATVESTTTSLFLLWSFITVVSIPTLLLSAAIKEHELTKQDLKQLAYYDPLTKLPNRTAFLEELDHCLQDCKQNQCQICAILFIKINNFNEINHTLGHYTGEELLQQVAERLKFLESKDEIIARFNEDDFVILLHTLDNREQVTSVAESIVETFKQPFILQNYEYTITPKIGIAYINHPYESSQQLVQNANLAMSNAQAQQVEYLEFTPLIREKVISYVSLKQQLNQAIRQQEFELRYQPIIDLANEELLGFEALIRWNNPQQGFVSPAKFIPVAEETGLITDIGEWVTNEACRQLQQWQQQFSCLITVNVNLSPKQLQTKNFAQQVKTILDLYEIDPHQLKLEITETAVLEIGNYQVFEALKAMGLGLYIDDFGMGQSSLSRLHQLPFDGIKIDRCFVDGIPDKACKIAVIQTIISLANTMHFKVIGEGIETQIQQEKLLEYGCYTGQGFLFGKPLTAEAATELIQQQELITIGKNLG